MWRSGVVLELFAVAAFTSPSTVWGAPLASCGFNSSEDSGYAAGELQGQGSDAGGWSGAWTSNATGVFQVVPGGSPAKGSDPGDPDQHLAMYGGISGTYHTDRMMDPWSGDFTLELSIRLSDNAAGQRDQTQIQFKNATGQRPLNIKIGSSGYPMLLLNDQAMIVQSGDALHPGMVPLGTAAANWVRIAIACDWETARFDLYWEQADGSMKYVNSKAGWKDGSFTGDIVEMEVYSPKAYGNRGVGMDIDRISIVPEPATIGLLSLVGTVMFRSRR